MNFFSQNQHIGTVLPSKVFCYTLERRRIKLLEGNATCQSNLWHLFLCLRSPHLLGFCLGVGKQFCTVVSESDQMHECESPAEYGLQRVATNHFPPPLPRHRHKLYASVHILSHGGGGWWVEGWTGNNALKISWNKFQEKIKNAVASSFPIPIQYFKTYRILLWPHWHRVPNREPSNTPPNFLKKPPVKFSSHCPFHVDSTQKGRFAYF